MACELSGVDPSTGQGISVTVEGGRIARVARVRDPEPLWLTPGLVDLQVNGYGGFDVNAPAGTAGPEEIVALVHALFRAGTTTVVPTVITAPEDQIIEALRRITAARDADPLVRHAIPFAHVEGPHLSDEDGPRGVHPREHIRPPDVNEFARWQRESRGAVGLVTVSPHWPSAPRYIAAVAQTGVRVALGHTHASPEQISVAVDAGASLATHLGNGAHARIRRHPNYVWAQLAEDRLTAGFIADGHHLPPDTLTVMLRAKGPDHAFLVSDAVALAGSPPGRYRTSVGGEVELSEDGRLSYAGTELLAGAARPLADGVAFTASVDPFARRGRASDTSSPDADPLPGKRSLHAALRLATWSPGRFCGRRGVLVEGAPADLIRFRWSPGELSLRIQDVVVAGTSLEETPRSLDSLTE